MKDNEGRVPDATADKSVLENSWSIRPCSAYKDEYDDCTSIKARFNQYFIHGKSIDCSQWKTDYDNCVRYQESNGNDVEAGAAVILSEKERRKMRMDAHFGNTIWKKRSSPPRDWNKPLPEWFLQRNKNSYLQMKQLELEGHSPQEEELKKFCTIM